MSHPDPAYDPQGFIAWWTERARGHFAADILSGMPEDTVPEEPEYAVEPIELPPGFVKWLHSSTPEQRAAIRRMIDVVDEQAKRAQ